MCAIYSVNCSAPPPPPVTSLLRAVSDPRRLQDPSLVASQLALPSQVMKDSIRHRAPPTSMGGLGPA